MDRNRSLLLGMFAVQLNKVTSAQIVQASRRWTAQPQSNLAKHFLELGALTDNDIRILEQLVDQAIITHNGDSEAAINTFGGMDQVQRAFRGSLPSESLEWDPFADTVNMPEDSPTGGVDSWSAAYYETPGRYAHKSEHARGGQGRLLIVHDEQLGRDIIMKELLQVKDEPTDIPTPMRRSASLVARFLQEAKITGQLEHPSIVPVYELGLRLDGTPYYTMKLLKGQTMAEAIRSAKTLAGRLALIQPFAGICHAMAYAHNRHVIHRDLKPQNVMVGRFGETVVLDWGLAKVKGQVDVQAEAAAEHVSQLSLGIEGEQQKTIPGHVIGTPAYMPPEQASGNIEMVDERSDVYSLGAILYEIITGQSPFPKASPTVVLEKVLRERPVPCDEIEKDVPPELAAICKRCMERLQQDRYPSALEVAEEIDRFMSGSLVRAYSYNTTELVRRFYGRNKILVNAVAVSLAAILSIGVLSYYNVLIARDEAVEAREIAEQEQYASQIRLVGEVANSGKLETAKKLLDETNPNNRGWEARYLANKFGGERWSLNGCRYGAFSGDGTRVAAMRRENTTTSIDLVNALDGKAQLTINKDTNELLGLSFALDDSRIVAYGLDRNVRVWNSESGELIHTFGPIAGTIVGMSVTPDGKRVAAGSTEGVVRIWDIETGALVLETPRQVGSLTPIGFSGDGLRLSVRMSVGNQETTQIPDHTTVVWDCASNQPLFSAPGTISNLSRDGKMVVISDGSLATLYDVDTGTANLTYRGLSSAISALALSHDGTMCVAAGAYGQVSLFSTTNGQHMGSFSLMSEALCTNVRFSVDDSTVVAVSPLEAYVVSTRGGFTPSSRLILEHIPPLFSCEISPDATLLLTGGIDDSVTMHPLFAVDTSTELALPQSVLVNTTTSPEQTTLGLLFLGQRLLLTDPMNLVADLEIKSINWYWSNAIAIAPGGEQVAFSPDGFRLVVWDKRTKLPILNTRPQDGLMFDLEFSSDGKQLLTVSWDGTAVLLDTNAWTPIRTFRAGDVSLLSGVIGLSGTRVCAIDAEGVLYVWNVETGELLNQIDLNGTDSELVQSPDGTSVFLTRENAVLEEYSLDTGNLIRSFHEASSVRPAAFVRTPSRLIAAGSSSNRFQVWSLSSGKLLLDEAISSNFGKCLIEGPFGPDETFLAMGDESGRARYISAPDVAENELMHTKLPPYSRPMQISHTAARVMIQSKERLGSALTELHTELSKADISNGFNIGSEIPSYAKHLGLESGDIVRAVNGRPVAPADDSKSRHLQALIQGLPAETDAGVVMQVERSGHKIDIGYYLLPVDRGELEVRLTGEEAEKVLPALREKLRSSLSLNVYGVRVILQRAGVTPVTPDDTVGIWITDPLDEPAIESFARKVGIGPGCRITSMNGQEIRRDSEGLQILDTLIETVKKDGRATFPIVMERGAFEVRTVTVRVED